MAIRLVGFIAQWAATTLLIGLLLRKAVFPTLGIADNVGNHPAFGGAIALMALALTFAIWVWIAKRQADPR